MYWDSFEKGLKVLKAKAAISFVLLSTLATFSIPAPAQSEADTGISINESCRSPRITLVTQEVIRGTISSVTEDTLVIITRQKIQSDPFRADSYSNYRNPILFDNITSIKCGDGITDGAIKGFLITGIPVSLFSGIVVAALSGEGDPEIIERDHDELKAMGIGLLTGGAIGAVFGAIVDASIGERVHEVDRDALIAEWSEQ
jgi:hypothetical protein